ncbi:hypothetical protein SLA2020_010200 [Shorea laevis]
MTWRGRTLGNRCFFLPSICSFFFSSGLAIVEFIFLLRVYFVWRDQGDRSNGIWSGGSEGLDGGDGVQAVPLGNGGFSVKGVGHGDGCKRGAVVLGYGDGPCNVKRADDEG